MYLGILFLLLITLEIQPDRYLNETILSGIYSWLECGFLTDVGDGSQKK